MARKQNRPERPRTDGARTRRWPRVLAVAGGIVLVLTVCILVCLHFMLDAMGPRHAEKDHDHPPGPHGGTLVAVGRESHFHVEAVFERSGHVRVYTYGGDETQVHPIDSQPVPATVRRPPDGTEFSVLLSPEPQPGDPPGKASRFAGRLPQELDGGRVELVVPAMTFGGERHWFAVQSSGEWHRDPMPEKVGGEEERKLYLTPGGRYTEADIKANGGVTASEKFKGVKAEHDAAPKPGDRICPVSRTKANPKLAWVVGGKEYQFCCPPCVDEFVKKAKEKPDEVRPPEEYVQKP
jgi:YHS domain-containing protein